MSDALSKVAHPFYGTENRLPPESAGLTAFRGIEFTIEIPDNLDTLGILLRLDILLFLCG